MQICSLNNSPTFQSITPIRVYQDGKEVLDERIVKNTCAKIIKVFSGPLETKFKPAAAQLEVGDIDYSYIRAIHGYTDKFVKSDTIPSDYIKTIYDRSGRGYLVTGEYTDDLSALGYRIGIATKDAKSKGLRTSPQIEQARSEYGDFVKKIGNDLSLRTKEAYNRYTGERIGNPVQIIANITTKPVRVKGKTTSKVSLDNLYLYSKK